MEKIMRKDELIIFLKRKSFKCWNFITRKTAKYKKAQEGEKNGGNEDHDQGMFVISKKAKKIHIMEICPEIEKLKRLVKLTYLAPYFELSAEDANEAYLPHYYSLQYLKEDAEQSDYLKCQVTAKLFSYSISSCPHIGSVFVYCKKCAYVNFIPFHLSNIYQEPYLKIVLKQTNDENDQNYTQFDPSAPNTYDMAKRRAVNYSLEWLKTAFPVGTSQLQPTQPSKHSNQGDDGVLVYKYACPRCELNNETSRSSQSQVDHSQTQSTGDVTLLDYMYRFWFKLRDLDTMLDPCLMEADVALKFLHGIDPLKFFTNQAKSNTVYKLIHQSMDKKYLFTFETFKLSHDLGGNRNETAKNQVDSRKPKILYKIIDFEQFAS